MDMVQQKVDEVLKAIKEQNAISKMANLVKDNKIEFEDSGKTYRVRKLTFAETDSLNEFKAREYFKLVNDKAFKFKDQILAELKEKGISLAGLDRMIKDTHFQIQELCQRLAEMDPDDEKTRVALSEQIEDLEQREAEISVRKFDYLDMSIENQLEARLQRHYTYLSLEVKVEEKWVRAYPTYEDFCSARVSDSLMSKAFGYVAHLIVHHEA